jgi:phosphonate transport system substrate-binding protein
MPSSQMSPASAASRRRSRVAIVCTTCLFALACAPAASAQDQPNPFRLLKPWLEGRFGESEVRPGGPPRAVDPDRSGSSAPPPAVPDTEADETAQPGRIRTQISPDAVTGTPVDRATLRTELPAAATIDETDAGQPRATAPREEPPQPLRLAVLAGRDPSALLRTLAPISERLGAELGRPVEFLPVATWGAMIDAQVERRIDGGFYSAAAYAVAEEECRCLEPLVAPASADGATAYRAVIVARLGSGIRSPADLAGRVVATGAPDSIGARRMQLAGLMAEGVDPGAFRLRTAWSAEAAVRLVLEGSVDAAFAWGSLGRGAGEPPRGTLAELASRGESVATDLEVIWRSAPIGHGPFAVLRTLSDAEKSALEDYLLDLDAMEPHAYDRLNPLYEGGYVAVEQEDYAGLGALATQDIEALRPPGGALR